MRVKVINLAKTTPFVRDLFLKNNVTATVRQINDSMREGLRSALVFWWKNYLPLHFREGNRGRYSYEARKPSYERAKIKLGLPGDLDLVFSGETKRMALAYPPPEPQATSTLGRQRGQINVIIPGKIKLNKRKLTQEIVAHRADEDQVLFSIFRRKVFQMLFNVKQTIAEAVRAA